MDLLCQRCGEPWELDYIQHEMTPEEREMFHAGKFCPCCKGKSESSILVPAEETAMARHIQRSIRDVFGDDLDALAAEMEDLGLT